MTDKILTLREMAGDLGVTQSWLKHQADAGLIPCLQAGRRYLFSVVAVQRAILKRAGNDSPEVAHAG